MALQPDHVSDVLEAFAQIEKEYGRERAVHEANLFLSNFRSGSFDTITVSPAQTKEGTWVPAGSRPRRRAAASQSQEIRIQIPPPELLPKSLCIYYGSYTKTCENLANRLKADAAERGLNVLECKTLDALTGRLQELAGLKLIIITSTIHGGPPPGAKRFVTWLNDLTGAETLKGTKFAVFGSGGGAWVNYQANAKNIYDRIVALGGEAVMARGEGNAEGSTRRDFAKWKTDHFWPHFDVSPPPFSTDVLVDIELPKVHPDFAYKLGSAVVEDNVVLTEASVAETRHITFKLPKGMEYKAGDYLSVLPVNPRESVKRAMEKFDLGWDMVLNITAGGLVLPVGENISPWRVFSEFVELGRLALEGDLEVISTFAKDEADKKELDRLRVKEVYEEEIFKKRVSPLDLLDKFPSIRMDLGSFLSILPPIEHRRYSISSSPFQSPNLCTLTYGVLDAKAKSGYGQFHGVASTFLSRMQKGFQVKVGIVSSGEFHLPEELDKTPIIMICAGTGLSPFRGFVQERARKAEHAGVKLAPALLFVGCRYKDKDRIHGEELEGWEKEGVVSVRYAYSQEPEKSNNCNYVQKRVWADKDEVKPLLAAEARMYICGNGEVGKAARAVLTDIYKEMPRVLETDIPGIFDKRLHEDVFT